MDALAFLDKIDKAARLPIYVLAGDEDFLKRACRDAIVANVAGDGDPEFAISNYTGDKLDLSTVRNELETLPMFAPCRVVIVDQADPFVTANRDSLERYFAKPSSAGVLILDVKAFPETTKLAKALTDGAKVSCKAPSLAKLADWCCSWAKAGHKKKLGRDAAMMLLELVGTSMGQLDQELEKLAVAIGPKSEITGEDIHKLVGRSRAANVFQILDAVGDGKPQAAFTILHQLFAEGEDPLAILGALTSNLRKLATVGRHAALGQSLGPAMDAAGVASWPQARQSAERQIKHLGMRRLKELPEWLIEINLGLKGGSPLPPRMQLERLLVKLARPRS